MKFFNNYNAIYLIPTIGFYYEMESPFKFQYLFLDLIWLKWGIEITIKKEKYA